MIIRKKNPFFIFSVFLVLILILHYSGIIRPLENFFIFISKPLTSRFFGISSDINNSFVNSQSDIDPFAKISELEKEIARLSVSEALYLETLEENRKFKETLKFSEEGGFNLLTASVIAGEIINPGSRDLTINRGSKDGLRQGLAIVDEQGVLVGKVVEVKDKISRICLSIGSDCEFAAAILNHDKTQGLVSGNLGLTVKMSYIPQLEKISVGDIVITSGLGGGIPRGLVIGKINEVKSESNDIWQEAVIEAPLNFNNLTVVSVVIP